MYRSRIEATYKAKFKSEVDQFPQDTQRTLKRANKTGHRHRHRHRHHQSYLLC